MQGTWKQLWVLCLPLNEFGFPAIAEILVWSVVNLDTEIYEELSIHFVFFFCASASLDIYPSVFCLRGVLYVYTAHLVPRLWCYFSSVSCLWELLVPNYSERYQLMPYTMNEWFCFHCPFHCHALEWQLGLLTAVSAILKFAVFCHFGCFDFVYSEKREIRMWIYFFYISYFSHVLSCGEEFLNIQ